MINFFADNSANPQTNTNGGNNKSSRKSYKGNLQNGKKKSDELDLLDAVKNPKRFWSNSLVYILVILGIFLLVDYFTRGNLGADSKPISQTIQLIQEEKVQNIRVDGDTITVQLKDGSVFKSDKESGISFDELLKNNSVDPKKISGEIKIDHSISFDQVILPILSLAVPILILFFIFRQMRSSSGDIFSFAKSKAKMFNKENSKITFDDVAGNDEAKKEMMEIVDFLKNPEKYRKLGARIPKGILLVGPAGVGKTLLAKAIAGEAGVPFFSVAGSEFMEMLVGVGSARARDLFKMAKSSQPSLIFIDEIDAIGRQRGMGIGGGHDEREQTLNQILVEMDGFDPRTNVIVLAATNRPDMLDPALIRAGRFDRRVSISLPDLADRKLILEIHSKGKPIAADVNYERIAKKTVGFSGADLENMLNEAAILAARAGRSEIVNVDMEEAALKVTIGSERRTLQTEAERKMTAYHEAGHALVATFVREMDPVYRISIVARGGSLGHTSFPPERDRYNETQTRIESLIATMLGGRAAEEIIFNELTVGASDDIDRATKLARKMVTEYGMSALGPISFDGRNGSFWLAREMGEMPHYSQDVASKIDSEINKIISTCYKEAKEILQNKKHLLDKISEALLAKETIDGDEYKAIVAEN